MRSLITTILYLVSSIAYAGISEGDAWQAEVAVHEGRIADAKRVIGSKDISEFPGILYSALKGRTSEPVYTCKTELVKYLLERGAKPSVKPDDKTSPPRASHFQLAVKNACAEIVEMFVLKMSPDEIGEGTKFLNIIEYEAWANKSEENAARVTKIVRLLADVNKKNCPDSSATSHSCQGLAHLKTELKGNEDRETEAQYAASPEGVRDSACEVLQKLEAHKKTVEHQRKIAKVSGTVDVEKLHYAGARTVELESELEDLKTEYKKLSKKALSLKSCP